MRSSSTDSPPCCAAMTPPRRRAVIARPHRPPTACNNMAAMTGWTRVTAQRPAPWCSAQPGQKCRRWCSWRAPSGWRYRNCPRAGAPACLAAPPRWLAKSLWCRSSKMRDPGGYGQWRHRALSRQGGDREIYQQYAWHRAHSARLVDFTRAAARRASLAAISPGTPAASRWCATACSRDWVAGAHRGDWRW